MKPITRRGILSGIAAMAASPLSGCGTWIRYEDIGSGDLKGRVLVEWVGEDRFVYRQSPGPPLSFRPSFMKVAIVPEDMFTDGGSVPRVFWGIPGLSPWALGPAYILHDWLFEVHRCNRPAPVEIAAITFDQSAIILAEVGRALIDAGLVQHNLLEEIVWAVRTRYARDLWDRPGDPRECATPRLLARGRRVVDFVIPPKR
jgi:uncharacterized protein DUF1353